MDDKNSTPNTPPDNDLPPTDVEVEPATTTAYDPNPTEPAVPEPVAPQPVAPGQAPKKKSKTPLIVGIAVGALLLLGGGGAAAAYNFWWQNPDKVVTDAIINAVQAETVAFTGSFEVTPKSGTDLSGLENLRITIEGESDNAVGELYVTVSARVDGERFTISGGGLYDSNGDLFFKVERVRQALSSFGLETSDLPPAFDRLLTRVDGNWIKISKEDIEEFTETDAAVQECVQGVVERLSDDRDANREISNLYRDNTFIVIDEKLGSEDGSLGYRVSFDGDAAETFARGIEDTTYFTELKKCDDSFDDIDFRDLDFTGNGSSDVEIRTELWVSRWSHQFTKISVEVEDDEARAEIVFEPNFNVELSVETPSDAIPFDELLADIEEAAEDLLGGFGYGYDPYAFDDDFYYYEYDDEDFDWRT